MFLTNRSRETGEHKITNNRDFKLLFPEHQGKVAGGESDRHA